ncbi:MAG: M20/M25/M40 family metallo-hydrolase [Cyclobacteriaceae bacterium]|nr:M20/M25/M40 family metallo-hydrolase [Cyclobacteriaceae bacterium]
MSRTLSTLCLIILAITSFGQKLSKDEKKIVASVDQRMAEAIAFLEKVVNINSGTNNLKGVQAVGMEFKKELDAMGFTSNWVDMPAEMKRAGHLLSEHKGAKGKKLLLLGHIDTVFEPVGESKGWVRQDTIAFGPGTSDMKGGDMVMLYALKALHDAKLLDNTQILVLLTGDEEAVGKPLDISRGDMVRSADRSDIALSFEGATGFEYATVARRGSSGWRLTVHGKQAHSSRIFTPAVGAGAIYESARILHRFYDELQEPSLTYSPGMMAGGTTVTVNENGFEAETSGKQNIVPNTVVVHGDLRFLSEEQKERTRAKMREIVNDNLPGTSAEIEFIDSYPSMSPKEGNVKVLTVYDQVSRDLGLGEVKPFDPGKRGGGDIAFIAERIDALDGLGAMGGGAHAPEEYVDLTTLDEQIKRAALLIYRLTREEKIQKR